METVSFILFDAFRHCNASFWPMTFFLGLFGDCQLIRSSSRSLHTWSTSSAWSGSSRVSLKRFHLPQPANKMASSKSRAKSCGWILSNSRVMDKTTDLKLICATEAGINSEKTWAILSNKFATNKRKVSKAKTFRTWPMPDLSDKPFQYFTVGHPESLSTT